MGVTVRQPVKGKGKPWYVFICQGYKRKSIKVGKEAEAEALAAKIREGLELGDLGLEPKTALPTFGEYAQNWLDGYGETHLKYSTWKGYGAILRDHLGPLQDRPLDRITRIELKELIFAKLKTGLAPATVSRIKALVSGILSHALEDDLIEANPALRLGRLIKGKDRKMDVNPLTREEAQDFLEALQNYYPRITPSSCVRCAQGDAWGSSWAWNGETLTSGAALSKCAGHTLRVRSLLPKAARAAAWT